MLSSASRTSESAGLEATCPVFTRGEEKPHTHTHTHLQEAGLEAQLTPVWNYRQQTQLEQLHGLNGADQFAFISQCIRTVAGASPHCQRVCERKEEHEPHGEVHRGHSKSGVDEKADATVVPGHEPEPVQPRAQTMHVPRDTLLSITTYITLHTEWSRWRKDTC
jgi:hypothetical protein